MFSNGGSCSCTSKQNVFTRRDMIMNIFTKNIVWDKTTKKYIGMPKDVLSIIIEYDLYSFTITDDHNICCMAVLSNELIVSATKYGRIIIWDITRGNTKIRPVQPSTIDPGIDPC